MASNLRKFVNHSFLKTVDLALMRRLLAPVIGHPDIFDLTALDRDPAEARTALIEFFAGPEDQYPESLIDDLHRIAELGTENGLILLREQAVRRGVDLIPTDDSAGTDDRVAIGPKHVALRAYLEHRDLFDEAADLLALRSLVAPAEYVGVSEGVEPILSDATRTEFEDRARRFFLEQLAGRYCRVGWYGDADDINIVVTHGSTLVTVAVVDQDTETTMSYRGVKHDVLSYNAATGRLKVGGSLRAARPRLAGMFAETMLRQSNFFDHEDSSRLYTLEPIERRGFGFTVDHAFDPTILRCAITEVQASEIVSAFGPKPPKPSTITMADGENALARLGEVARDLDLSRRSWQLNFIKFVVTIDDQPRRGQVTVKLKPPSQAAFKRVRHEARIMELLRRNGFCVERTFDPIAAAAE